MNPTRQARRPSKSLFWGRRKGGICPPSKRFPALRRRAGRHALPGRNDGAWWGGGRCRCWWRRRTAAPAQGGTSECGTTVGESRWGVACMTSSNENGVWRLLVYLPPVTSARRSETGAGGAGVELLLATFFAALLQLVNFSINELTFVCRRKATRRVAHGREGEHHLQRLLPQHTLLVAVLHHLRLKPAAQQ